MVNIIHGRDSERKRKTETISCVCFWDIPFHGSGAKLSSRIKRQRKDCNLCCPWCHNPETIAPVPQTLLFQDTRKLVSYGMNLTVEEAVESVMRDVDFYKASQGGVAVSRGEPMLQPEGVAELCRRLRQLGVTVET